MLSCPFCYNPLTEDDKICSVCGAKIINESEKEKPETKLQHTSAKHSKRSPLDDALAKLPFKVTDALIKKAVTVFAVVLTISIIISFFKPSNSLEYALYGKDEEVFISKVSNISPKQVTNDYGENYFDNNLGISYRLSENGRKVFFFDYGSNNLYYRTSKLNKESIFLASNVLNYDINESANLLTYLKDGNELYQHNLKNQLNMIDNNVVSFVVSDDGKTVLYTKFIDNAYSVYRYKFGKASELAIADISSISHISDDLKTIIYVKKGNLFKEKIGSKAQKISINIDRVIKVYDENRLYFTAKDPETSTDSLYYYSGKKAKCVINDFSGFTECAEENPAIAFRVTKDGKATYFIAVEDKVSEINKSVFDNVYVDPSGKSIHFIADADPKTYIGDLYKASISKNGVKNVKLIDKKVYGGKYLDKGKFAYLKNYNSQNISGEVFINGKSLGVDISWLEMKYNSKKDSLIFFRNTNGRIGDMYVYKNGKSKIISENVLISNYCITENGNILYLADFSETYSVGDLYLFNGSKSKGVDLGVSYIAEVYNDEKFSEFMRNTMIS